MTKKTLFNLFKYVYFTIVLLLPFTLILLLPEPHIYFVIIPELLYNVSTNLEIVIYFIFLMSINFFIAFKLHEIHKRKSIARSCFRILLYYIAIIFFAAAVGAGEGVMVLFVPLLIIFPFNPLYFFGILYYHRITEGVDE